MRKLYKFFVGSFIISVIGYIVSLYMMERDPAVMAVRLNTEGNFERAIAILDGAIADDPERGELYCFRGIARLNLIRLDKVMEDMSMCVRLRPEAPDSYLHRAHAHLMHGDHAAAMADVERALSMDAKNYGMFIFRASVLKEQGELKRALMDVERAFELAPALTPKEVLNVQRAILRRALKDYDGAIEDLDAAALQNRKLPAVFLQRGITRRLQGDSEGAQQDFDRYLELRPTRQKYLSLHIELAEAGRLPSMREDVMLAYNADHGVDSSAGAGVEAIKQADATPEPSPKAESVKGYPMPAAEWRRLTRPLSEMGVTGVADYFGRR